MNHFVVAKKQEPKKQTASGLLLPEKSKAEDEYIVESVGKEVKDIKAGDRIVFKEYSATTVKLGDDDYSIVKDDDILATL